jgi:hypothetical protein
MFVRFLRRTNSTRARDARRYASALSETTPARLPVPLEDSPSLNDPHQDHDNRDDEEDVDETADRVGRQQTKQPKNDEDNGDCL